MRHTFTGAGYLSRHAGMFPSIASVDRIPAQCCDCSAATGEHFAFGWRAVIVDFGEVRPSLDGPPASSYRLVDNRSPGGRSAGVASDVVEVIGSSAWLRRPSNTAVDDCDRGCPPRRQCIATLHGCHVIGLIRPASTRICGERSCRSSVSDSPTSSAFAGTARCQAGGTGARKPPAGGHS